MELDLSGVKQIVEDLMLDSCRITEATSPEDAVLNEETGVLEPPEPAVIYEGKCQVWSSKQGAFRQPEGFNMAAIGTWYVEIPMGNEDLKPEQIVTITAVNDQANAQLLDLELTLISVDLYTHSVSTIIRADSHTETPG